MWISILSYVALATSSVMGILGVFGETRRSITIKTGSGDQTRQELTGYGRWTVALIVCSLITSILCQAGKEINEAQVSRERRAADLLAARELRRSRTWVDHPLIGFWFEDIHANTADQIAFDEVANISNETNPIRLREVVQSSAVAPLNKRWQDMSVDLHVSKSMKFDDWLAPDALIGGPIRALDDHADDSRTYIDKQDDGSYTVSLGILCTSYADGDCKSLEDLKGRRAYLILRRPAFDLKKANLWLAAVIVNNIVLRLENPRLVKDRDNFWWYEGRFATEFTKRSEMEK